MIYKNDWNNFFLFLYFRDVCAWLYFCVHVFVYFAVSFNLKDSVSLSFSLGSHVNLIKAIEWLVNWWQLHPTNLVSSFSNNYLARERPQSPARTGERIVNVLVWVLMLRRRDSDFLKVKGAGDWDMNTVRPLIKCIHTVQSNETSFPFGMYYWRLHALGGLGANLTEFLTGPIGNSFRCSHASVSAVVLQC